jgi:hypothetical protein
MSAQQKQVPKMHRQILQQLHLLLRHRRQRQVPAATPAHHPDLNGNFQIVDRYWRQPDESSYRRGNQDVFYRSLRQLG